MVDVYSRTIENRSLIAEVMDKSSDALLYWHTV